MRNETISIDQIFKNETSTGKDFWVVKSGDVSYFVWDKKVADDLMGLSGQEVEVKVSMRNPEYPKIKGIVSTGEGEDQQADGGASKHKDVAQLLDNRKLKAFILKTLAPAFGVDAKEGMKAVKEAYKWIAGSDEKESEEEKEVIDIDEIDI